MLIRCPGCIRQLAVDDGAYQNRVLLQCPECKLVFMASAQNRLGDTLPVGEPEDAEDATVLTSDSLANVDPREFQWNVPGASVTIIDGDDQGIHLKLQNDRLLIGRKDADLCVNDKSVSRHHAELIKREDGWHLLDKDSTNGVFLNGERIDDHKLAHLDEIRIGRTRILFAETEAEFNHTLADRDTPGPQSLDVTKIDKNKKTSDRPLPADRELFLEFMAGKNKGRSFKFQHTQIIIGRGEEADLVVPDDGVSRKHALIEVVTRDQIYITDLASQNGVWLNGLRIRSTRLIHGDLIRVGATVLKFVVQDVP